MQSTWDPTTALPPLHVQVDPQTPAVTATTTVEYEALELLDVGTFGSPTISAEQLLQMPEAVRDVVMQVIEEACILLGVFAGHVASVTFSEGRVSQLLVDVPAPD